MKIALVTSLDRGGPVEQAVALATALVEAGDEVRAVCASEAMAERFAAAGADTAVIGLRGALDGASARRIWRRVAGADVAHAHDRRANLWVRAGPRPRRGGVRAISVHGLPEPYLPQPVGPPRPGLRATIAYRGLDAALCHRAELIVVPSRAVAAALARRVGFPRPPHGCRAQRGEST